MKTRRPPCLDWREKLAMRHEDLSPADQRALDAHVSACDACSEALADYHFFEARLDALPPPAIKPLPRLSPHFFEQASREQTTHEKTEKSRTSKPEPAPKKSARQPHKITTVAWRFLGSVALLCLLLGAGVLFRMGYLSHLAARPFGDTLLNLNQHTSLVNAVGWSPDGQDIATASADGTVKVWNAQNGSVICTYVVGDLVYALAWSPDSKYIAAGNGDNTVKTFSAANCSATRTYVGHTNSVLSIAWSRNGQYLAAGSSDHSTLIWNVVTGAIIMNILSDDYVASVAWAPNNHEIAIGAWDETAQVWDIYTQKQVHASSSTSAVNAIAWSPDGKYVAIGNQNGTIEVRDASNWNIFYTYTQQIDAVLTVAWSPNGKYIASGGYDGKVRVWNPFNPATPTLMIYTQHTDNVSSVSWSPDSKEIVSGSWDNTAKVWVVTG